MPVNPQEKSKGYIRNYVFHMIETLLPKGIEESNVSNGHLKMMELYGEPEKRRGWIHVNQK